MKDILQKWLLQIGLSVDLDNITRHIKDGLLFVKIFKNYDCINISSIKSILHSNDDDICKKNLTQLKIWFKFLDIDFTDDVIYKIIGGDSRTSIDILFKMFLVLEDKNTLQLMPKQKERLIRKQFEKTFHISKTKLPDIKDKDSSFKYSDKLIEYHDVIQWFKKKEDDNKVKKRICSSVNFSVSASSSSSSVSSYEKKRQNTSILRCSDTSKKKEPQSHTDDVNYVRHELYKYLGNSSDEECILVVSNKRLQRDKSEKKHSSFFDTDGHFLPPISQTLHGKSSLPHHVQMYLRQLKLVSGFSCKRRRLKKTTPSIVLNSLLEDLLEWEFCDLRIIVAHKLLKQSNIEKQMSMKLYSILHQSTVLKESYVDLQDRLNNVKKSSLGKYDNRKSDVPKLRTEKGDRWPSVNFNVTNGYSKENLKDISIARRRSDMASEFHRMHYSFSNNLKFLREANFLDCDVHEFDFDDDTQQYTGDIDSYYKSEKQRTIELHRKLYAEKLKSRFERHYIICLQTVEDIIDLAIRKSEFTPAYGIDVPSNIMCEWKCLFFTGQPIFDIVDDFEKVLFPDENNETFSELVRQDILNDYNFERYHQVAEYWDLFKNMITGTDSNVVNENQILLGYIVHRLLEAKYPSPSQAAPADIPKYCVTAVVNEINDTKAIEELRGLLMKAKILLVDVKSAIRLCLEAYKDSLNLENSKIYQDLSTVIANTVLTNSKIDVSADEEESKPEQERVDPFNDVFTQTSSSLLHGVSADPLTEIAKLGQDVFDFMLSGKELPTPIIVDAMITYIKVNPNINGWVVLNFPSTLYQASVLEFALTSKKFPFHLEDDVALSDSECTSYVLGKEVLHDASSNIPEFEVKNSRIVPNPKTYEDDDTFKTYLTTYVICVPGKHLSDVSDLNQSQSDSESTLLLEHPEKEGVPTVQTFYQKQGIAFNVVYDKFNKDTLRQLARVLLIPYFEELDSMDMLHDEFEPDIYYRLHGSLESHDTVDSERKLLRSPLTSGGTEDGGGHNTIHLDKQEETVWNFCNMPLIENVKMALACYWEALESNYVSGFKNLALVKRNNDFSVLPYLVSCLKKINSLLKQNDNRQVVLTEFLDAYNKINQVLRFDVEIKNELHLRVCELREQLKSICENKQLEAFEMVHELILHNFTYQEIMHRANHCMSMLQIEADRCTRTLNLVKDYYLAMLGIYTTDSLQNVEVPKFVNCVEFEDVLIEPEIREEENFSHYEDFNMNEEEEMEAENEEHMLLKYNITVDNDNNIYKSVIERLLNYKYHETENSPPLICKLIEANAKEVINDILKLKSTIESTISKHASSKMEGSRRHTKASLTRSQRQEKRSALSETNSVPPKPVTENDNKQITLENMFTEWKQVVKNEIDRFKFRLELIIQESNSTLQELETLVCNTFLKFHREFLDRYSEECNCIDEICTIFQVAIEERTSIDAQMMFKGNEFYVIRSAEEAPLPNPKLPPALGEMLLEESFIIKQLEAMKDRLMYIAPSGVITQEAFVQFMQSIILHSSNVDTVRLVPNIWMGLNHKELTQLFENIFGFYSLIEWREFFIYCLDLPYPLTEEIIDAKLQFMHYDPKETENITYDNYMKTTLWFQRELPESPLHALRNVLAKEFLFSLFKDDNGFFNYSLMLLSFCKDVDCRVGFGKSISLLMGRCVIVYEEDLYLEHFATDHINMKMKIVSKILVDLINDVVNGSNLGVNEIFPDLVESDSVGNSSLDVDDLSEQDATKEEILTESMYHEFFRRHSILRWTSRVPASTLLTAMSFYYFPVLDADNAFLEVDILESVRDALISNRDKDIYLPAMLQTSWMKDLIGTIQKFKALSIKNVIKEIIKENKIDSTVEKSDSFIQ